MRAPLLVATALLLLSLAAHAGPAEAPRLSAAQCGVITDYDVRVDDAGIRLQRDAATPREIRFHDGQLSIDGQRQTVSAADAQRLRAMEDGVRKLMPAAASIATESLGITFDTLDAVYEAMTGDANSRKVRGLRREAERFVSHTLGRGRWEQDAFDEGFDARVEAAAESLGSSMARGVLWTVFTGRAERLERRADKLDAELERRMAQRSRALEQQARAFCVQVQTLEQLHQALEFRYNGQALRMMHVDAEAILAAAQEAPMDDAPTHP